MTRVSSQKISSASSRAIIARLDISSKLPIGVGTKVNIYGLTYFFNSYLALNFSTLPAASTNFCSPVKNG